ncbi:hypothetical protein [Nonomuraea zeae]|uniref:Uncharacterized protein n=1 Tax=Nonomuraea zeae TaxID=1642303 RepID=A0A5S4G913_9ACTN|nr:hypothetical protein [Nonomuraea zeae]TMR29433.1 hypothetical protein ETD85_32455 [Nonomuraea zeae]
MKNPVLLAGMAALIALPALLVAGPAAAAPAGKVILYRNADFAAPAVARSYLTCAGVAALAHPVGSFDNQPLPGCSVLLQTAAGATFTLCTGRGVVPPAYRAAARAVIKPGTAPPCMITTATSAWAHDAFM